MSKQYYIQNMCWGWFMGGFILYLSWGDDIKYKTAYLIIAVYGIILFPLSKWVIECFFLKFTTREFWNRGVFMDTPGKMGGLAIYHGTVFLFSIPITLFLLLGLLVKKLLNK